MSHRIGFVDTTFRDGQQCLWATRMTTAMIAAVAPHVDRSGYDAVEIVGAVTFDACIRYLKESPWERVRLMRRLLPHVPLRFVTRCRNFISFDVVPEDVVELVYARLYANGLRQFMLVDGLHDLDNIRWALTVTKGLGFYVCPALIFSISPVHTDAYYVEKARAIRALGADALVLKDVGGLLTVDRVRTLVPALREVAGDLPLEIHAHCSTGLAPLVVLEAVQLGVDAVYSAIPPLADGQSHPSVLHVAANLKLLGYDIALDLDAVGESSRVLQAIARQERLPMGTIVPYDLFHYQHQVPGGMQANLRAQLRDAGLGDKFHAALEEVPRLREELGWPVMVSPFSQFVGIQALINVVQKERYATVLDEIAKWAYGYYGKLEAPIDPNVMDRIVARSSKRISPCPRLPEPALPALRRAFPEADDDELVLRAFFKGTQIDDMLAAQPMNLVYAFNCDVVGLVQRLIATSETGHVVLTKPGVELAWQR